MAKLVSVRVKPAMSESGIESSGMNFNVSGALVFSTERVKVEINCFGKDVEIYLEELQSGGLESLPAGKSPVGSIKKISRLLNKREMFCSLFYEGERIIILGEYNSNKLTQSILGRYVKITNIRKTMRLMRFLKWF